MSFFQTLRDNVAFLMLVLPLFGAALVLVSAGMGVEAIRRTALTNAVLTLGLAVVMVAGYDPAARRSDGTPVLAQMRSELRWLGTQAGPDRIRGPDVRISVGVDGLSLWFLALTATLAVPAVMAAPTALRAPATFYAVLLAWESSLIGLFAACDVVLFSLCLTGSLAIGWLLIAGWGGTERRQTTLRMLVPPLAGGALVLVALTGLVVSQWWMLRLAAPGDKAAAIEPTFDIPTLVRWVPFLAAHRAASAEYWAVAGPTLCGLVVAGFWMGGPFPPFHAAWSDTLRQSPRGAALLYAGVWISAALYGLLRFVPALFESALSSRRPLLLDAAMGGSVFLALLAWRGNSRFERIIFVALVQMAQCAAGAFSDSPAARSGSVLLAVNVGLCVAVLLMTDGGGDPYDGSDSADEAPLSGAGTLAIVGLAGAPGLGGFAGLWLLWQSIAAGSDGTTGHPAATALGLVAAGIAASVCGRIISAERSPDNRPAAQHTGSLGPANEPVIGTSALSPTGIGRRLIVAALLAAAIAIGVMPKLLVDRIAPTIRGGHFTTPALTRPAG